MLLIVARIDDWIGTQDMANLVVADVVVAKEVDEGNAFDLLARSSSHHMHVLKMSFFGEREFVITGHSLYVGESVVRFICSFCIVVVVRE